jgi:hypothetical protein
MERFNANIDNVNKLIFLSDIHGDIMGFIVNMRDCAKVIRKRKEYPFDQNKIDDDLIRQMNVNLNKLFIDKDTKDELKYLSPAKHDYFYENLGKIEPYNDDMNYEWIGGDTHVVIVGDIIDNIRKFNGEIPFIMEGEHIHEEIKLLRFINAIDDQAKRNGGRIIKLFGNHDAINVIDPRQYEEYHSRYSDLKENNYHDISRLRLFTTKEGKDLLKYNGIGVILKINNYLCVHASFGGFNDLIHDPKINDIQKVNDIALEYIFNNIKLEPKHYSFLFEKNGLLINRKLGDIDEATEEYNKDKTINLEVFNKDFCENILIKNIKQTCLDDDCKQNIKLVLGHCPQFKMYSSSSREIISKVQGFTHESNIDGIQDLKPIFKPVDYNEYHYGISHACSPYTPDGELDPKLYKVDVGVSRAFDLKVLERMDSKQLYNIFKSRSPQVLTIDCTKKPHVARTRRSTIRNMFIHQPRSWLQHTEKEAEILKLEETNINQSGGLKSLRVR